MKILFFDGYCSMCNAIVDWGMRQDRSGQIKFAPLQGQAAQQYLKGSDYTQQIDTVVYYRDEKIFERSVAVLQFLNDLGGIWKVFIIFLLLPSGLRDFFYRFIAQNRYVFFKKRDTCRMPTPQEHERLLE